MSIERCWGEFEECWRVLEIRDTRCEDVLSILMRHEEEHAKKLGKESCLTLFVINWVY